MDSLITKAVVDGPYEYLLHVSRTSTGTHGYATTSATGVSTDSEVTNHRAEHRCWYKDRLVWTQNSINDQDDYFLLEHLNAGHLTPCNLDDKVYEAPPIREELPFDQIYCLKSVHIKHKLRSPRHIRLLKLYSPIGSGKFFIHPLKGVPLRCEAYQASLDDLTTDGPPLFAAVSYVCGDQTRVRSIQCGQKNIGIPQNVYDVLCHLRLESRPRLVWIDYLCIRQHDAGEKSHQVRLLHKIYAQAHVVSWLGTGRDMDLNLVGFYLSLSARLWIEAVRADKRGQAYHEFIKGPTEDLESYMENQTEVELHERAMQALGAIANAEYFGRVWIVQEFILGKTKTCQIGDTLHSVAVLAAAAEVLRDFFNKRPLINKSSISNREGGVFKRALLFYFRPALRNHWLLDTDPEARHHDLEVVTTFNKCACSDPRDYIFGVTSLFKDPDSYPVDYTLSKAEVFADFTVHCLSHDRDISVLNQGRLAMGVANARPDLPTWCPDWSIATRSDVMLSQNNDGAYFNAVRQTDRGWQASGKTHFVYSRPSRTTLAVRGFAVSTLELRSASTPKYLRTDYNGKHFFPYPWWSGEESSKSLRAFFDLQGKQLDHNSKDIVLRAFDRILHPTEFNFRSPIIEAITISPATRSLLDRVDSRTLLSMLTPPYLAEVDSEPYEAAGFEQADERIPPEDRKQILWAITQSIWRCNDTERLFFTDDGMLGVGCRGVQKGDLVCIINGRPTPQILRQADEEGKYIPIGPCIVDGLMYGEGMVMGFPEREFVLI